MNYGRSSTGMEVTAMILGIVSLAGNTCFYLSLPAGGMAIILALLSRGSNMQLGKRAKIGLWLAIGGICATILFYSFALFVLYQRFGSFEAIYAAIEKYSTLSFTELLQELFNQPIR